MPSRRFLLDVMLGKLATYLRMCGYDAAYALDRGVEADDRVLAIASEEGRTLLTRDRQLAARATESVLLESKAVTEQLRELSAADIELTPAERPSYCGRCNGHLEAVPQTSSTPAYAPDPAEESVWECQECGQQFWTGSHWEAVVDTLAGL